MQTANITLHIGGDAGNSIPKVNVTPAEIMVLQTIHGEDSVVDIEPGEDVERTNRQELERLQAEYGRSRARDTDSSALLQLAPVFASKLPETFDALDIDDSFYKPTERATPKKAAKDDGEAEAKKKADAAKKNPLA